RGWLGSGAGGPPPRLLEPFGNPLDWRDIDKTLIIQVIQAPIVFVFMLRARWLMDHPAEEPYFDRDTLAGVVWILRFSGVLSLLQIAMARAATSRPVGAPLRLCRRRVLVVAVRGPRVPARAGDDPTVGSVSPARFLLSAPLRHPHRGHRDHHGGGGNSRVDPRRTRGPPAVRSDVPELARGERARGRPLAVVFHDLAGGRVGYGLPRVRAHPAGEPAPEGTAGRGDAPHRRRARGRRRIRALDAPTPARRRARDRRGMVLRALRPSRWRRLHVRLARRRSLRDVVARRLRRRGRLGVARHLRAARAPLARADRRGRHRPDRRRDGDEQDVRDGAAPRALPHAVVRRFPPPYAPAPLRERRASAGDTPDR